MPEENHEEPVKLTDAARYVFEECRMVLPGIQALFGFQMISVFNQGFAQKLTSVQQKLHGGAILLVTVSIALIMSPAAIHRRAEPKSVSDRFVRVASRLVLYAMILLAIAISVEIYIVTSIIWNDTMAMMVAIALFCLFLALWELYPTIFRATPRNRQ